MGHEHRLRVTFALAVEDLAEVGVVGEPGGDVGEWHALQPLDEGIGRHASAGLEVARGGFAQVAFPALEFGDELVAHQGALVVARDLHEFARELGEGDGRVDHHGLHGGQALQGFVDLHRVEDAKSLLADLVAQAGGAAEHLVEQDAAVDAAQEHEVADLGHVHAGGEQVHRDRDVGVALVLVAADQLQRLVGSAGDLDDGIVVDAAVVLLEGLLEQVHDQVGVGVVDAEDERLLARRGVEFLRQELAHDAVEGFGDDFAVEVLDVELDLVGGGEEVELVAVRVVHLHLFSHLPDDAGRGELGS